MCVCIAQISLFRRFWTDFFPFGFVLVQILTLTWVVALFVVRDATLRTSCPVLLRMLAMGRRVRRRLVVGGRVSSVHRNGGHIVHIAVALRALFGRGCGWTRLGTEATSTAVGQFVWQIIITHDGWRLYKKLFTHPPQSTSNHKLFVLCIQDEQRVCWRKDRQGVSCWMCNTFISIIP